MATIRDAAERLLPRTDLDYSTFRDRNVNLERHTTSLRGNDDFSSDSPVESSTAEKQLDENSWAANALARSIMTSQTYQVAYNAMINYPDWVSRLKAIPYSFSLPDETFWDKLGFSNKYTDAVANAYNEAMSSINNLLAEFQSYIKSLPITEIQEYAQAGINADVTGAGVTSSEIAQREGSTPSFTAEGTNSLEQGSSLMNVAQGFLSFTQSAFNIFGSVYDIKHKKLQNDVVMQALELAEQEGLRKEEVHELLIRNLGIFPNRANFDGVNARTLYEMTQSTAEQYTVQMGENQANPFLKLGSSDPSDTVESFSIDESGNIAPIQETVCGVFNKISTFKLHEMLYNSMMNTYRRLIDTHYLELNTSLESQYMQTTSSAGISMNLHNSRLYGSTNLSGGGKSLAQILAEGYAFSNEQLRLANDWQSHKANLLSALFNEVNVNGNYEAAPFIYNALYGTDLEFIDSFSNSSRIFRDLQRLGRVFKSFK